MEETCSAAKARAFVSVPLHNVSLNHFVDGVYVATTANTFNTPEVPSYQMPKNVV